jgi:SAM-dependent methyltransferase
MRKMGIFFRRSRIGLDPLALSMSGVRAGERLLQIGLEDAPLAGRIAARVGLNGHAVFVVGSDRDAATARAIAAGAGVLTDVHTVDLAGGEDWPVEDASIDVVVIHGRNGLLASLEASARVAALARCHRVLRPGGRLVAIDAGALQDVAAWFRRGPKPNTAYEAAGGAPAALHAAGFKPVRVLAEREGFRFTEGARPLA